MSNFSERTPARACPSARSGVLRPADNLLDAGSLQAGLPAADYRALPMECPRQKGTAWPTRRGNGSPPTGRSVRSRPGIGGGHVDEGRPPSTQRLNFLLPPPAG